MEAPPPPDADARRSSLFRLFAPPRKLPTGQRRLLLRLGVAFTLNSYDFGILSLALPQLEEIAPDA